MKETSITTSYRHLKFYQPKYNKDNEFTGMEAKPFIKAWFEDVTMKTYEDMAIYPPPLKCPDTIFNLWKPFEITKYKGDYLKDEEGLEMFKNHIKILCGNDDNVKEYIINWVAQMFQYPATKTIIPTFISKEGAGKGSLLELLCRLMGFTKTLVTTTPSRDVWGSFNGLMSENFLVNLNEMSKKETLDSEGKIKGLITDPQLTINKKGIDSYTLISFHRFIITTNNEDPMKTKKDDRRNIIIRSSDEKCNDKEYFKNLREKLENINVMRTIYDYLMDIKGLHDFHSIPMPKTAYQEDMKEQNRCFYDCWVEDYIRKYENEKVENLELKGDSQYKLFKEWCSANGITFETSSIKMSLGIKRLNIEGIKTGVQKRDGNYTQYNINKLKKHYKIGCLIKLDN
jgi:sporulation protein YlmC with PRC-barrel domain